MSRASLQQLGSEIVERRHDVRVVVSIPGRYSLASKRDPEGNPREFSCRAVNMSARAVTVAAPVLGSVGEHVVADIERFGRLEGTIARVMERGFLLNITASVDERARIAEKIIWLEENRKHELPDTRQSDRMVPRNPNSTLTLSDGSQLSCFVIDMSATGAAVSADILPEIGTPMAVGQVLGRVVRRFREGFAIKFFERLPFEKLESLLTPS